MKLSFQLCLLLLLTGLSILAQEPEPLDFFPHHVGDMWVYRYDNFINRSTIITSTKKNDIDNTAIHYDNVQEPAYVIHSNYDVYFYPETFDYFLEFKLTAKQGDSWRVTTYSNSKLMARVQQVYTTLVFGQPSTVMAINYYEVPDPDTIITDSSPYRYTHLLASGFGFIRQIGESGDVPIDLVGCIINGKSFGTVTDVLLNSVSDSLIITAYPNPCFSFTTIHASLPNSLQKVHLALYNSFGTIVWQQTMPQSMYTLNTDLLPAGLYFCKATASPFTAIHKILIQR